MEQIYSKATFAIIAPVRKVHVIGGLTFFLTVTGAIFLLIFIPPHQQQLTSFVLEHPLFAPLLIIGWWIISIIIPPIPAVLLSFAFIPIIGWFWAYMYSLIGILIGTSINFGIARKFREPLVKRFVPIKQLHDLEDKLSHRTEFFAFLGIRLTTASIFDFISYAAGLSKISYKKFLIATLVSEIPQVIWYYLGGQAYKKFAVGGFVGMGVIFIVAFIIFYFIRKQKIFDKFKSK